MVPKHVAFAPGNKWGLAPFILKASLSSPSERNLARSDFLTVFSPYSLRQARGVHAVDRPSMSEQGELRSRREERMENGVKNLKGSEAISQNLLVAF